MGSQLRQAASGRQSICAGCDLIIAQPPTPAAVALPMALTELPPEARTIYRVNGHDMRETARDAAADALAVHPDVNVIFGINDDSALGALDAYRAARLDEAQLLVVSFGLEGAAAKELMAQSSPFKAGVAMFPELVGRICIDTAICAYHGCPLPERLFSPYAIVTQKTLFDFYNREEDGQWLLNWDRAGRLLSASPNLAIINECNRKDRPAHISCLEIFTSHEWYQNMQRSMKARTRQLGISLEVVDVSQDMAQEINALKRAIGYTAVKYVGDGDTIIIDSGVTATYLAAALRGRKNITVITNSLSVLAELCNEEGITLVSSGGIMRPQSHSLTGPGAEATFQDLRADRVFIAGKGFSRDFGPV